MKFSKESDLDKVLNSLIIPYKERVPDVYKVIDGMLKEGMIFKEEAIKNDHIAFRTLGVPNLGIASLEKIFLHYGYEKRDYYFFPEKKLNAFWYSHPEPRYPRIFISELRVSDLSQNAKTIIKKYTGKIKKDPVDKLDFENVDEVSTFFTSALWELPTLADYQSLQEESEYAAWVIYNRYYLNHFTISIHDLPDGYNSLKEFNTFLKSIGIKLNNAGGEIKVSKDGFLKQSSSVAGKVTANFQGSEVIEIPGSYVEFAERLVLPQFQSLPKSEIDRKHRRDGFEAANADKIFESTYESQQE
ncbi:DUF1338 domain-containing protein [Christiangramia forsetii]|uniref:2-oxoadipate dioxygenase/decarboxylase n=2 Tax=Christiangramia forsetii TaxID=411153 RepID=A0M256_CHRFK|nr:DUF1338 domain-containing protein [Christiangramia forsetii]GGG40062.1 DUF1338 domain-containing protein [Christiangramia forsetii]CAL66701.1 conserved hypothetical protein [Christiangramia forsetii KT0803]